MSGPKTGAFSCPSAQPDMAGAQVLGVVEPGPDGARLAYVNGPVPVSAALLKRVEPVPPTLVYRFAAPCEEGGCAHFDGHHCALAQRVVEGFAPSADRLPACAIRKTCRWHAEQGEAACLRCSQVVTRIDRPDPMLMEIAGPGARP